MVVEAVEAVEVVGLGAMAAEVRTRIPDLRILPSTRTWRTPRVIPSLIRMRYALFLSILLLLKLFVS